MAEIKAIETHYNGHRFRSRLEARWAVFFDAVGITYEYEPEGYVNNGQSYLPDFYLPYATNYGCFVEVKPNDPSRLPEIAKAVNCLCFQTAKPLVILGDIPLITDCSIWCYPMFGFNAIRGEIEVELVPLISQGDVPFFGQALYISSQTLGDLWGVMHKRWPFSLGGMSCDRLEGSLFDSTGSFDGDAKVYDRERYKFWEAWEETTREIVKPGYEKARAARFEFGENG